MRVNTALVVLIVPSFLLFGCTGNKHEKTASGWWVAIEDHGQWGTHTRTEILALFDAAMTRAAGQVEAQHGVPASSVLDRAKNGGRFTLVDGWHFTAEGAPIDFPGTQWTSGEIDGGSNIKVAFYSQAGGTSGDATLIPMDGIAPYQGPITGNWYWGVEVEGGQFPALDFELGHEWGF